MTFSQTALPQTMHAIHFETHGGPDVLRLVELPVPQPKSGDVLIRVAAAGINAPDISQRRGHYPPPPDASPLLGLEVSGEIVGTGEKVVALCNGGGYAEYVAVPAGQVLPLPTGWNLPAGAALPETFFTVQQTLVMRAGLEPGMHVLIHGAAGGIGGAAIQIAKLYGALPIAVVSSPEKAAYARSLGAVETIDHTTEDFVARAREITGGKGVDRVLDIVGGETLTRNIEACARGGHIVQVSSVDRGKSEVSANSFVAKWLTLSGSTLRPQTPAVKARIADSLRTNIWPALADGRIVPPRIRALPIEEAERGHRAMEARENYGKIIMLTEFGRGLSDNSIESL